MPRPSARGKVRAAIRELESSGRRDPTAEDVAGAAGVSVTTANKYLSEYRSQIAAAKASGAGDSASGGDLAATLAGALAPHLESKVDQDEVDQAVFNAVDPLRQTLAELEERLSDRPAPKVTEITIPELPKIEVTDSDHPKLAEAIELLAIHGNLWLAGPAGSGKTTLARQAAEKLQAAFGAVECTAGLPESVFTGRQIPNLTTGEGTYQESEFVRLYENGGLFLADEADALDDNVRLSLNTAIANGSMGVPNRSDNPRARRSSEPPFYFVMATNTWGHGPDADYTGRDSIDAATRDRFAFSKLWVDYSLTLERSLVGEFDDCGLSEDGAEFTAPASLHDAPLQSTLQRIRKVIADKGIRRILSTRGKVQAQRMAAAGWSTDRILSVYLQDWSETERAAVLSEVA